MVQVRHRELLKHTFALLHSSDKTLWFLSARLLRACQCYSPGSSLSAVDISSIRQVGEPLQGIVACSCVAFLSVASHILMTRSTYQREVCDPTGRTQIGTFPF